MNRTYFIGIIALVLFLVGGRPHTVTANEEANGGQVPSHELDLAILSVVFEEERYFGSGISTRDIESAVRRGGLSEVGRLLSREGQVGLVARTQARILEDTRGEVVISQEDRIIPTPGGDLPPGGITNTSTMTYSIRSMGSNSNHVEFSHDLSFEMRLERAEGTSGRDRIQMNWSGAEYVQRRDGVLTGRFTQLSPSGVLVEYVFIARINPGTPRSTP
ncbi:MAG: hypothetical protein JJU11_13770 [Candidatus Sumerlaeia bacterium]|nr:hypothetical protein [Candidatus Sumerlaeia bacterium]